jgi:hypothetical protein
MGDRTAVRDRFGLLDLRVVFGEQAGETPTGLGFLCLLLRLNVP